MKVFQSTVVILCVVVATLGRPQSETLGKRLIKTSDEEQGHWVDEASLLSLKESGVQFMDITGRTLKKVQTSVQNRIPDLIQFQSTVNAAISKLNTQRTRTFLEHFTSYFNRHYAAETGKESALWLLEEIQKSITESRYNGTARAETYAHSWLQPSIIATLEGSDPTLSSQIVILGAHLDSLNFNTNQPAPGADDNGSGSAALLEALRALLESDFIPKRTVQFQWYAAEEVGLLGSGDIAEAYANDDVDVVSMMNFDVVGYNAGRNEIGIITDHVDSTLTAFLRSVIDAYLTFTWTNISCGYACSDHASFTEHGFPSSFPVEIVFFPYMHTARDTIDVVNFDQLLEFSKLAVGYAIEVSQPNL